MTRGWFDLFRDNGGPTLYAYSNRTSVIADTTSITLYVVFATLFIAFFVIFPGMRKERFTTFLSVTLSLFVGVSILIGNSATGWHTSEAEISSAYRSFSNEKINGRIGVYIGMTSFNVTLEAMPQYYNKSMDVNFNEKFVFDRPNQLKEEYRAALVKGLPYPILTVAEYMSVDAEGFCWGRSYREAGYYTSIALWASFGLWLCMNILIVIVPRYGGYCMSLTGFLMLLSNALYVWLVPGRPLRIRIEDVEMTFELGWSFWLVLVAGACCLLVGLSISIIDLMYPHKFSTVLEMDYGTPFDRHTIIEDSHETKKKKKWVPKIEEPSSGGFGGLLRRLSKRDRDRGVDFHRNPNGADNYGYDMDAPKSPWRYPQLMFRADSRKNKAVSFKNSRLDMDVAGGGYLRRTDSKDSQCSSVSSMHHHGRDDLRPTMSVPANVYQHRQFRRTDSTDSNSSSLASFGLGFLNRNNSKKVGGGHGPYAIGHPKHNLPHQLTQSQPVDAGATKLQLERGDSSNSVVSRGYVVSSGVNVINPDGMDVESGTEAGSTSVTNSVAGSGSNSRKSSDEVSIVVSGRKNSLTKAVRRNSTEHKRDEASMW